MGCRDYGYAGLMGLKAKGQQINAMPGKCIMKCTNPNADRDSSTGRDRIVEDRTNGIRHSGHQWQESGFKCSEVPATEKASSLRVSVFYSFVGPLADGTAYTLPAHMPGNDGLLAWLTVRKTDQAVMQEM